MLSAPKRCFMCNLPALSAFMSYLSIELPVSTYIYVGAGAQGQAFRPRAGD